MQTTENTTAGLIELTEDEFDAAFSFVPNHLNLNASWAIGDGPGCLFETYGDELDFVRRQAPRTIWTIVDGDDGDLYVINGYHHVNRVGYLLSVSPVDSDLTIQCRIPMNSEAD